MYECTLDNSRREIGRSQLSLRAWILSSSLSDVAALPVRVSKKPLLAEGTYQNPAAARDAYIEACWKLTSYNQRFWARAHVAITPD